jgi:hypothetical protein
LFPAGIIYYDRGHQMKYPSRTNHKLIEENALLKSVSRRSKQESMLVPGNDHLYRDPEYFWKASSFQTAGLESSEI